MKDYPKYTYAEYGDCVPPPCDLWSACEDDDALRHEIVEAAVDEWLEDHDSCEGLPRTVTVYGFRRDEKVVHESFARNITERLVEMLDEDYGPDGGTKPTPGMYGCGHEFVRQVVELYPVWRCSLVCSVEVSRADYLAYDPRAEWHVEG